MENFMERQTILIVDDAEINRMMLMDILGDQYVYREAADGSEALRLLEQKVDIDLVLLDLNMPGLNGFRVLEEMNRFQWISEVPVVMITAEESSETMEQAYALGVTDYIPRPFNAYIVRRRVENTLRLYVQQKRLMKLVSDQIAEKEENNTLMVSILSNVVEIRNHESGDHIRNIRQITELLLHNLVKKTPNYHLTEEDISLIKTASSIHDIGKITIPEEILNKPGKLTKEEFDIMKTHASAGAHILEQMKYGQDKPLYRYAMEICRWHHERWDGHGYPDGLMGEQIPIAAQVVSVADVYDALTSERCYKKAFDHETALHMILNGECGAFSPLMLECLVDAAPQLRLITTWTADVVPYRMDQNRLSDEILSHADLPSNNRVQNLLDVMQEQIDFFASVSGGIQFKYDAVSGLVDVMDWNEPPKYRHTVRDVRKTESFHYLSAKDFARLRDALAATTQTNPEFSMSMLLPVGNAFHWCDLRVRTLWTDRQPVRYIAAVGQLIDLMRQGDPALPERMEETGEGSTLTSVQQNLQCLQAVFDVVRLVDPINSEVLELDKEGILRCSHQHCAAFWNRDGSCTNCTSARALAQQTTVNKLEFTDTETYFVISKYLKLNGTPCVLEMLSRVKDGRWIDSNGSRFLLSEGQAENLELFTDPVTDTFSRRYYETYRTHLEGMECVAIIDVDRFKQVNDTFGHQTGDQVLKEVAAVIQHSIRKTDVLIRYGGDEFLLLFPKMEEEIFRKKLREIRRAVKNIRLPELPELTLSISIGGVMNIHPITEAIRQADLCMYADKQNR